jgi:NADPH2:quinone reductase
VTGIHDDFTAEEMYAAMEQALQLLGSRRLEPVIGLRLPLEQAIQAHRALEERRVLGKTVLTP